MEKEITLDFLVLGVQKAGTTSLHDMLARHSDIALPATKETHFFSHADRAAHGIEWYLDQFKDEGISRLKGEIDPEYLYSPTAPDTIRRLTTVAKFVVILRHPLDRAFSHYQMSLRRGYERLPFGEALAREQERLAVDRPEFALDHYSYASRSLYAKQIGRFLETFPDAAFLFIRSGSLSGSGYEQVCDFIGTRPVLHSGNAALRSNSASQPRSRLLRDLLYAPRGKSALRILLVKAIPPQVKQRIFHWLDQKNQKAADLDRRQAYDGVPKPLLSSFLKDLRQTEEMTGLDLADWRNDIENELAHGA
ncbi:sulfotransferase family protein [Sphingobium baderi]|uniref:sulfotransferase family protein n=1 Tax=Sphingobium baderi TaxID=1332080 RepID=UPI002B400749|nr:sulfotransferase [Sphingobium baderi]WRD78813.1 sulfotransferase [Sphingobium baderi]